MRQYGPGGQRGPWVGGAAEERIPFQRTDGTVMTGEEIANVTMTDQVKPAASTPKKLRGRQPIDADRVWKAVERLGTQTAAARELGTSQGTVQSALKRYMRFHGIDGPLPGLLKPGQLPDAVRERMEAVTPPSVEDEPMGAANMAAFLKGASESAKAPVVAIVHHGDPDALAAAFSEGFDTAREQQLALHGGVDVDAALIPLILWLGENAPSWNDVTAERWLKAFTATIDLVYPTRRLE